MPDIEAFVWHDLDGNITAVGYPVGANDSRKVVEPIAGDGRRVLKVVVAKDAVAHLHLTHGVDLDNKQIVPRNAKRYSSGGPGSAPAE